MAGLNTKTLGDLQVYAKSQFGDTSGVQITNDDISRAANEACMEIVSKNRVLRASATTDLVKGQNKYDKPGNCLQVTSVKYDKLMLSGVGFDEFQSIYNDIEAKGSLVYWTQYGDTLVLGGTPSKDELQALEIYYVPEPSKVSNSSDVLPLPDRYYNRICEFVMSKLYELDEDWDAQQINKKAFNSNLASLNYEDVNNNGPFSSIIPYDL